MSEAQLFLFRALGIAILWPLMWAGLNLIFGGERPLLDDFYIGAVIAGVGLRLMDAWDAARSGR